MQHQLATADSGYLNKAGERLAEHIKAANEEKRRLESQPRVIIRRPSECPVKAENIYAECPQHQCKAKGELTAWGLNPENKTGQFYLYDTSECWQYVKGKRLLENTGLVSSELNHTFEAARRDKENKFLLDYLEKWTPNQGWIYITARKDPKNNPMGNGTGKSYAMEALVNRLCCEGIACSYTKAIDLTARLRRSYQGGSETEHEILRSLIDIPVLIMDDIGKENLRKSGEVNEWAAEKLYYIIERRSRYEDRPIGFTSNFNLDELADRFGDNYGPAMASRIAGRCKGLDGKVRIWALSGPDRRL